MMMKMKRLMVVLVMMLASLAMPLRAAPAPESFAPLVEKLMPAVVNIATAQKVPGGGMGGAGGLPFMFQLPDDPQFEPFRQFFENFGSGMSPGQGDAPAEREVTSLGSGFIIAPDGYVVTNNHVIDSADEIHVILQDDTKLDAKIIGRDPKTDLALIKVESDEPLPYVSFGDSDAMRVGDWVVAIGNPFGLGGSVTAGIISARSRSINAGPFDDFLQTDAAINRGNSGGPMFNIKGEVIGINTAIFSPTGGNVGIGFAVPSALAKPVLLQLKEHGRTFRGWLGVKIQEVTDEVADSVGLGQTRGALVLEITKGSPAQKADIKPGDVILEFDGKPVGEMRKLPRIVAETKVGKRVEVVLWRDGEKRRTSVTLGELDESETAASPKKDDKLPGKSKDLATKTLFGMQLTAITAQIKERFALPKAAKGLLVLKVKRGTPASKQAIRAGDIISRVNADVTESIADFEAALTKQRKAGRDYALVHVNRKGETLFVTLPTRTE